MIMLGVLGVVGLALVAVTHEMVKTHRAQGALSADNERRANRLAVLERTGRRLQDADLRTTLRLCTEAVAELGFDAASLLLDPNEPPVMTVGDWRCVAPDRALRAADAIFTSDPVDVLVTTWKSGTTSHAHHAPAVTHSVSAVVAEHDAVGSVVLVGWSTAPIADDLADCFGTLMRYGARALAHGPVLDVRVPSADELELELVEDRTVLADEDLDRVLTN